MATGRLQALNRFLRKLQRIADEHGVAVVITNQAGADVAESSSAEMESLPRDVKK